MRMRYNPCRETDEISVLNVGMLNAAVTHL